MTGPTEGPIAQASAGSSAASAVVAFRRPGVLLCGLSRRKRRTLTNFLLLDEDDPGEVRGVGRAPDAAIGVASVSRVCGIRRE